MTFLLKLNDPSAVVVDALLYVERKTVDEDEYVGGADILHAALHVDVHSLSC